MSDIFADAEAAVVPLVADAGNPAVRIEILDGHMNIAAVGYGLIETELPPGVYRVRYTAGDARHETRVLLEPGEPPLDMRRRTIDLSATPALAFTSAAPFDLTRNGHADHQQGAQSLSRGPSLSYGAGSEILIFCRDTDAGAPASDANCARGLSLHRMDNSWALYLEHHMLTPGESAGTVPWCGQRIEVEPGHYRLRYTPPCESPVEMAVAAFPGFQTQAFLVRRKGTTSTKKPSAPTGQQDCDAIRTANQFEPDLHDASVFVEPAGRGFVSTSSPKVSAKNAGADPRTVDIGRQALGSGRRGTSKEHIRSMLQGKWSDPLVGTVNLHLMLRLDDPDFALANAAIGRIREMIGAFRCPDVDALEIEIARRSGRAIENSKVFEPLESPPLLRSSWVILVRASAQYPSLIRSRSLTSNIADKLVGTGAWLVWETPVEDTDAGTEEVTTRKRSEGERADAEVKVRKGGLLNGWVQSEDMHRFVKEANKVDAVASQTIEGEAQVSDAGQTADEAGADGGRFRSLLSGVGSMVYQNKESITSFLSNRFNVSPTMFETGFQASRMILTEQGLLGKDAKSAGLQGLLQNAGPIVELVRDSHALSTVINWLVEHLTPLLKKFDTDELLSRVALSDDAAALIGYLDWAVDNVERMKRRDAGDAFDIGTIVATLGLPTSRIAAAAESLAAAAVALIAAAREIKAAEEHQAFQEESHRVGGQVSGDVQNSSGRTMGEPG